MKIVLAAIIAIALSTTSTMARETYAFYVIPKAQADALFNNPTKKVEPHSSQIAKVALVQGRFQRNCDLSVKMGFFVVDIKEGGEEQAPPPFPGALRINLHVYIEGIEKRIVEFEGAIDWKKFLKGNNRMLLVNEKQGNPQYVVVIERLSLK